MHETANYRFAHSIIITLYSCEKMRLWIIRGFSVVYALPGIMHTLCTAGLISINRAWNTTYFVNFRVWSVRACTQYSFTHWYIKWGFYASFSCCIYKRCTFHWHRVQNLSLHTYDKKLGMKLVYSVNHLPLVSLKVDTLSSLLHQPPHSM